MAHGTGQQLVGYLICVAVCVVLLYQKCRGYKQPRTVSKATVPPIIIIGIIGCLLYSSITVEIGRSMLLVCVVFVLIAWKMKLWHTEETNSLSSTADRAPISSGNFSASAGKDLNLN